MPDASGFLDRAARVVTEVFSPAVLAAVIVAVVAWDSTPTLTSALVWGLVAVLFGAVFPLGFLLLGVRAGRWSDHHVSDGSRRRWPLVFCAVSVATGAGIGWVFDGPLDLMILAGVMCAAVAVVWVLTDRFSWKVSVHSLLIATTATVATTVFGGMVSAAVWPVAALVGWSRVRLRAHTPAQVVVGALIGIAAAVAFAWLR